MADVSHSLRRNQSSATLAKKMSDGNGFTTAKTVCSDVFGGSRVEDYSEIFGSFHTSKCSSIPILDIPVFDQGDVCINVPSSEFEYSEVFGGFDDVDFAVPYEELFAEANEVETSYEETWTPAETGSPSERSNEDPFACSKKNRCLSNGASDHLFDGVKQLNMSYHKINQRSKEVGTNATTHIAQFHAIPGFTFVVDESIPVQKTEVDEPLLQGTFDIDLSLNVDCSGEIMEGKHIRKTMSHTPISSAVTNASGSDLKPQRGSGRNESYFNEVFVTVSDINLRTKPSQVPPPLRPPPKLANRQGDPKKLMASNLKASENLSVEGFVGNGSLPPFDVEVDANSSAAAAMKEVMEKAQVRLKSAKESMKRKENLQSLMKLGLKDDIKSTEIMEVKAAHEVHIFKKDRAQEICERQDSGTQRSVKEEMQKAMRPQEASDSEVRGSLLTAANESVEKKHGRISRSSQESHKQEERVGECKAEEQIYEVVITDRFRAASETFEQVKNEKRMMLDLKSDEREQNEMKAAEEAFKLLEKNENLKAAKEACEQKENEGKWKEVKKAHEWKKYDKKLKVAQEVHRQEKHEKKLKVSCEQEKSDKKLKEGTELEEFMMQLEEACEWKENRKKLKVAHGWEENDTKQKEARAQEDNKKRQKEASTQAKNEKRQNEAFEREKDEKRLIESCKWEENEKRLKEACEPEENKKRETKDHKRRQKETHEQEENERRLKEIHEWEEIEKRRVSEENERILDESREQEENEKKQNEIRKREENDERLKASHEQEENEKKQKEIRESNENEKRLKKACVQEANGSMQKEVHEREANEKKPKGDKQAVEHKVEKNLMTTNKACKLDDCKNFRATQEDSECEENIKKLKAAQNAIKCETNWKMVKVTKDAYEHKENGKELEATKVTNEQGENERRKAVYVAQSALEHEENMKTKNAKVSPLLDDSEKKLGRPQVVVGREQNEKNNKASQMAFDLENFESKLIKHQLAHEGGENGKSIKEDQVAFDQEVNESKFEATQVGRQWVDNGKKMEAAQPANAVDEKRNTLKVAREADTSQDTERKEKNSTETPRMEDNEKEEWKQQERKQEKKRLRKMEEERDKESKREKDRVAVERATRKAHERAFSEASDRADRAAMDRATAEARQRAMAEARERLEKASSEAWDNSLAAKDSMEARIMVERAAVERATVEARERAVEKAIAEKVAMEAREQAERSLCEKVSATPRDSGMKQSSSFSDLQESQFQNSGSSHSSRYPDSLNHGASYATEKFQVAEGESAQRCKARLERHKRTIERAAKALAEKNMRDLLVQREQAERNRLSEALDADVKRWSSGKEGNLRALLSTLQYILGSDSGWQPIPLTDVITAVGVKKAYRKANLCVHPDKLQQRGASVQQKYICEKVFDLLKEAWNKFNSEER